MDGLKKENVKMNEKLSDARHVKSGLQSRDYRPVSVTALMQLHKRASKYLQPDKVLNK